MRLATSLALLASLPLAACGGAHKSAMVSPAAAPYHPGGIAVSEQPLAGHNTEEYDHIAENAFRKVADAPLSTFSIDVDTASYSNVRRFLSGGRLPPADAVRVEELINYFSYSYPQPTDGRPFSVITEVGAAPWNPANRLVHIGLQGKIISPAAEPDRNLVFLLDVSGSMDSANKLGLLKQAFSMLTRQLDENDSVAIVVYAGASGVVLEPTAGDNHGAILGALERLSAGGSTNGGAGIELAYRLARERFKPAAINRVILATDGDFNIGTTDRGSLIRLIERERKSGVYLTLLGFGMGNLKDSTMEQLANKGNGNYAYIDSADEARKVLVDELGATLVTIAEDVKIQVELNPATVASYRLIGYENRLLKDEDFNDDDVDAGEIGSGHTVTALYEIVPAGAGADAAGGVDALKYQKKAGLSEAATSGELMTVKLRYKAPQGEASELISTTVSDDTDERTSENFRFSAAVAGFGMLLRDSKHAGELSFADVLALADGARANDRRGYRAELVELVKTAARLKPGKAAAAEIAR
jgi:Ca-activated chloride channel family protein